VSGHDVEQGLSGICVSWYVRACERTEPHCDLRLLGCPDMLRTQTLYQSCQDTASGCSDTMQQSGFLGRINYTEYLQITAISFF